MIFGTVLAPGLHPLGGCSADRAKMHKRQLDLGGEGEFFEHAEGQVMCQPTRFAICHTKQSIKGRACRSTGRVDLHDDWTVQQVPANFM